MTNTLIIGFNSIQSLEKGNASWKGDYLKDILLASEIDKIKKENTKRVIGYFTGKIDANKNCYDMELNDIFLSEKSLVISYSVLGKSDLLSSEIKSAVIKIINSKSSGINNFPFCIEAEDDNFNSLIEEEAVIKQINKLRAGNDWKGICNMFEPIDCLPERKHLWGNVKLLDTLSFAAAKLSEVYINLKHHFKTDEDRDAFLNQQKEYRDVTIRLRKRCIELFPSNAGYFSNLAYTHYQSIRELMTPGGRRDGNIKEEAMKCIEYIDKALEIDPTRITDLYRKGQVLTSVIARNELMRLNSSNKEEKIKMINSTIHEGIKCFQRAEESYEIIPLIDEKGLERYFKEYIKSLYNCASAYGSLVYNDRDMKKYFIKFKDQEPEHKAHQNQEHIDKAIYYMEKCIEKDSRLADKKISLDESLNIAKSNGAVCGVYKLYSIGKFYFQKYNYLTGEGKINGAQANESRYYAEEHLKAALKFPWTENFKRQNKGFIAERLGRVYLSKGEYNKAMEVIAPFIKENTDYYIRYTYAAAAYKCGEYETAGLQIKKSLENKHRNKEIYLGHFIDSCIAVKKGDYKSASISMGRALEEGKISGKKNLDSLYLTSAFIESKAGNRETVIKMLELAMQINPMRKLMIDKFIKGNRQLEDFDLLEI